MCSKRNDSSAIHGSDDLTGKSRIIVNVITSWGSYLVFVVAGFILPRLIDMQVGQAALGIWDFCWSIVAYLRFARLGVGSSVNRYVAKYRAVDDLQSLGVAISSVVLIQAIVALMVSFATIGLASFIPDYFAEKFGENATDAAWVIGFLGMSLVFRMLFDPARGVVTGCHRWDIHNGIQASSHLVSTVAMIIVLMFGGGLAGMAASYAVVTLVTELVQVVTAFRVCKGLSIKFSYVRWHQIKKMGGFGLKTVVANAPVMIITQTTIILLTNGLGPAALAIFARPLALVRHINTFISKFAFVLTPTAGSMQGAGNQEELRKFFILVSKYGVALTLPLVLILVVFGDLVLELWMGKDYVRWELIAILAIGYFLPISQSPALQILMGMNKHGKVSVYSLFVMLIVYLSGLVIITKMGWSLERAAMLVVVPLIIGNGIILPAYACKVFDVSIISYLFSTFVLPVLCCLVYVSILVFSRYYFSTNIMYGMGAGLSLGGGVLIFLYWNYLLGHSERKKLRKLIRV